MKSPLTWFMSRLGYVPVPSKIAANFGSIKIDINSTSVDASIKVLDAMTAAADRAEAALLRVTAAEGASPSWLRSMSPVDLQFATAALVADETPALLLAEARKQTTLLEVLAKQGDASAKDTGYSARMAAIFEQWRRSSHHCGEHIATGVDAPDLLAEVRTLRAETAELRMVLKANTYAIAKNTTSAADLLDSVIGGGPEITAPATGANASGLPG